MWVYWRVRQSLIVTHGDPIEHLWILCCHDQHHKCIIQSKLAWIKLKYAPLGSQNTGLRLVMLTHVIITYQHCTLDCLDKHWLIKCQHGWNWSCPIWGFKGNNPISLQSQYVDIGSSFVGLFTIHTNTTSQHGWKQWHSIWGIMGNNSIWLISQNIGLTLGPLSLAYSLTIIHSNTTPNCHYTFSLSCRRSILTFQS